MPILLLRLLTIFVVLRFIINFAIKIDNKHIPRLKFIILKNFPTLITKAIQDHFFVQLHYILKRIEGLCHEFATPQD